MGQASRTTKLLLDLAFRTRGGVNTSKRAYLEETAKILDAARAFYLAFFLAHSDKLTERVRYFSEKHQEERERLISPNELLTWAESLTVATAAHPHPLPSYHFSEQFPEFPFIYRRSVIKDALGKARSYLSNLANWNTRGKKKGQPGSPGASNHPTLYDEAFCLDLDETDLRTGPHTCFARLKVYTGTQWQWHNYPVELNVKNLAVVTVRQDERIIEAVFLTDHGLDQARYRHLKKIARKQWQTGKPIKGEHSNQQLWRHVRRTNEDAAHKVAHQIAEICAKYPGCILLFERLRKIRPKGGSKSRRMNRRQANQLRGKINQYTKDKAYASCSTVTVEVNPHGTSQYCSRCGAKGERFSHRGGKRIREKWGKLFFCPVCHYEANADFNASVNVHRSFYREWHWQPRNKPPRHRLPRGALDGGSPLSPA